MGSFATCLLPETQNVLLPDTIEQVEHPEGHLTSKEDSREQEVMMVAPRHQRDVVTV